MTLFSTVDIYVKDYVKIYLEKNYGKTVKLEGKYKEKFIDCLKDKNDSKGSLYIERFPYDTKISVAITEFEFYHYGIEMTKSNMQKFSRFVEYDLKDKSRLFLCLFKSFGLPYTKGIQTFQKAYKLSENDFNFECIRKDFQRNGSELDESFSDKIVEMITNISEKTM